ncbi:hypothetical protein [Litorilituus lipolyticus]|uniref:Uncharacterized protein n=1 Tax=Litorilituus lipolyticus TaxID=2491017 RepID=A0A502KXE6_9GAMM|nr:hypothetical protein [Litorilituus lipolyticus]TPH15109.1 hypothetical protein EPA86_09835 [Litorilituus lipolyticus]
MKITLLECISYVTLLSLATALNIDKVTAKQIDNITDGPYVRYVNNSDSLNFVWLCNGKINQRDIKSSSLERSLMSAV